MVANRSFLRKNARLLYILAGVLLVLWFLPSRTVITSEEEDLWNRVRSAQDYMYEWRSSNGVESDREHDPWKTGLIGIEWSPVTTTLGSLESKRTACDPRWSIVTSRWFEGLGLSEGDPVAIFSSGSFPGLLLNALCAAEDRGLDIFLVVSLGSSTWGANLPGLLWSDMGDLLRNAGFISTVAALFPALVMKLMDFVALYGLVLIPMGGVIFADFYFMDKLGLKDYYAERRGINFNWAAGITWFLLLIAALVMNMFVGVELYFLPLPAWILSIVLFPLFSKIYQKKMAS